MWAKWAPQGRSREFLLGNHLRGPHYPAGQLAPVTLTVPSSIPAQFNQRGQHSGLQYKFQSLLSAEGATYNWMWQVIRNM
jgi:hypothetical protein